MYSVKKEQVRQTEEKKRKRKKDKERGKGAAGRKGRRAAGKG